MNQRMVAAGAAILAAMLPVTADAQSMLILHEAQAGGACYRATRGAPFLAALPATAGSGLVWTLRDGDGVEQLGAPMIGQPAGGGMIAGGPQIQTLRLRVTQPGRRTFTLAYARPGAGMTPVRVLTFCVTVPSD